MPAAMNAANAPNRTCTTPGCTGRRVTKTHCNRCRMTKARGGTPGPRKYQPRGQARVAVYLYLHPELYALANAPETLAAHGVSALGELAERLVAEKFNRPDLALPRKRARGPKGG